MISTIVVLFGSRSCFYFAFFSSTKGSDNLNFKSFFRPMAAKSLHIVHTKEAILNKMTEESDHNKYDYSIPGTGWSSKQPRSRDRRVDNRFHSSRS